MKARKKKYLEENKTTCSRGYAELNFAELICQVMWCFKQRKCSESLLAEVNHGKVSLFFKSEMFIVL